MCTFLFQILPNDFFFLANNTVYLMPETITNETKLISIKVQSDLRQRQHFFSVVHFTPVGWSILPEKKFVSFECLHLITITLIRL